MSFDTIEEFVFAFGSQLPPQFVKTSCNTVTAQRRSKRRSGERSLDASPAYRCSMAAASNEINST